MKKIIKLTETDLTNIVKRVIKENAAKDSLIDMIKYDGWESAAELVGGDENLKRVLNFQTPMDYLNLFNDMDVVQSEEKPDWTLFYYDPKQTLMSYDRKKGEVWVNYRDIGSILMKKYRITIPKYVKLILKWLDEVYNIKIQPYGLHPGVHHKNKYLTQDEDEEEDY